MKKICLFILLPVFLYILSCCSARNGHLSFEGIWQRTDIIRHSNARIEITDSSESGFSFNMVSYWGINVGELSGTANYVNENTAEYLLDSDEGTINTLEFKLTKNGSTRMEVTYSGDYSLLDFGMNVFADGIYVLGEPEYISDDYPMLAAGNLETLAELRQLLGEYIFSDLLYIMREGYPDEISEHRYKGFIKGIGLGADLLIGDEDTIQLMMYDNSNYVFYTNNMSLHGYLPDFIDPNTITGVVEYMYRNTQEGYTDENVNIHPIDTKLEENLTFFSDSEQDKLKFIKTAQSEWESELLDVRDRLRVTLSGKEKQLFDKAQKARESYAKKINQLYEMICQTAANELDGGFSWYTDAARLMMNNVKQQTTDLVRYYDRAALWYAYINADDESDSKAELKVIYKEIAGYFTGENKKTAESVLKLYRDYVDCETRFTAVYLADKADAADTVSLFLYARHKTETENLHSLIKSAISGIGYNPWKPQK